MYKRQAVGKLKELGIFGDDYQTPDGTGVRDYIPVSYTHLLFEEGTKLAAACAKQLDQAEQKVLKLSKGPDGAPVEQPFEEVAP